MALLSGFKMAYGRGHGRGRADMEESRAKFSGKSFVCLFSFLSFFLALGSKFKNENNMVFLGSLFTHLIQQKILHGNNPPFVIFYLEIFLVSPSIPH